MAFLESLEEATGSRVTLHPQDEVGLIEACVRHGWDPTTYPADQLASVAVPNPSEVVRNAVGTPSVA